MSPQASAELWPDLFAQPAVKERREEILNKMRVVRPVVETGCVHLRSCGSQPACAADNELRHTHLQV